MIANLAINGIQSLGTVNKVRLGKDLKILSIKDLKKEKMQRGYSEQWAANCDNTNIVNVIWYNNKLVVYLRLLLIKSQYKHQEDIARNRKGITKWIAPK